MSFDDSITDELDCVEVFEAEYEPLISSGEARRIAMEWHGGQTSALYSFGSTGRIRTEDHRWGMLREIRQVDNLTPDLRNLIEFIHNAH